MKKRILAFLLAVSIAVSMLVLLKHRQRATPTRRSSCPSR